MTRTKVLTFVAIGMLGPHLFADRLDRGPEVDRPPPEHPVPSAPPSLVAHSLNELEAPKPGELWEVFKRNAVRHRPAAKEFFRHPTFLALEQRERSAFVERIAFSLPHHLLSIKEYLPEDSGTTAFSIALALIESQVIRQLSRLSLDEQLDYLLAPHITRDDVEQRKAALERLKKDPAVELVARIDNTWLAGLSTERPEKGYLHTSSREMVQTKVMIARNLYFQGKNPTRNTVRAEYRRILYQRQRYQGVGIFARRQVLYAASARKLKGNGAYIYGRPSSRRDLTRHGIDLAFFRPEDGEEPGNETKKRLDTQIELSPRPTLLFEGDGRPNALQFHGALSAKHLAKQLSRRQPQNPPRLDDVPIVIMSACRGHDVGRAILDNLHRIDPSIRKPIIIVPAEFGQDFTKFLYNDPFLARELTIQSAVETTVGSLIRNGEIRTSVYVPDENNIPLQIF